MKVRANADTPADARAARSFGAEGIGLCRTEHMFFDGERIVAMREMILADTEDGPPRGARQAAADAALGFRRAVRDHGRPAGDHPPARSAAARIPAAHDEEIGEVAAAMGMSSRRSCGGAPRRCTSSTRCSAIAAAGSPSPIPRSPRCRPAPSSRRPSRPAARPARRWCRKSWCRWSASRKELDFVKARIDAVGAEP